MLPRNARAQQSPIPKTPAEVPGQPPAGALVFAEEQTISAKLMAADAVPRSNTEVGWRILKGAPTGGPVFKTFADFLGAVEPWPLARLSQSTLARPCRTASAPIWMWFSRRADPLHDIRPKLGSLLRTQIDPEIELRSRVFRQSEFNERAELR
jgi:hypothetical protein